MPVEAISLRSDRLSPCEWISYPPMYFHGLRTKINGSYIIIIIYYIEGITKNEKINLFLFGYFNLYAYLCSVQLKFNHLTYRRFEV